MTEAVPQAGHARGTPGYRRLVAAVWAAGVGTFSLLYAPQALLPLLARDLSVSPSTAALSVSVTTGALGLALLPMAYAADRVGRVRLMSLCLGAAAVLGLLAPLAPGVELLLLLRAVQGVALAGVPALAMAHVAEQVRPAAVGAAMGLYIAGTTVGGLLSRLVSAAVADAAGWRAGAAAVAVVGGLSLLVFRLALPPPVALPAPSGPPGTGLLGRHLRDPGVRRLCLTGALLMAAFVSVYNYLGFRLLGRPFELSPLLVGLVFTAYLAGTAGAPVAGRLGDRLGRRAVLLGAVLLTLAAALLTLSGRLSLVLVALVLFTVGFFAAHTAASGMVGNRARVGRSQASALYLLAYYSGSSVGGWAGGLAYEAGRWPGLVAYVAALLLAAVAVALLLVRTPPLPVSLP